MARLITSGFDIHATATFAGDPDGQISAPVTRDTTIFRSGVASHKFPPSGSTAANTTFSFAPGAGATVFTRCFFYFDANPNLGSGATAVLMRYTAGAVDIVSARLNPSTGNLELWNDVAATIIGSASSFSMQANQWYRVELSCTIGAGATDAAQLLLNGDSIASASSLSLTDAALVNVKVGWQTLNASLPNLYADDLAINDSSGANNNTWPGDGKVVLLSPISDNARTGFTGGAGGTTNLFDAVNNTPPVGVADTGTNTSQIRDPTSSTTDNYDANMTSYSTAGIQASDKINAVQWNIAHGAASATSPPSRAGRLVSNPAEGGDTTLTTPSSAVGTFHTNWFYEKGPVNAVPSVTLGTSPVLRVGKRTASTRVVDVCAMFIYVDYTPRRGIVYDDKRVMRNSLLRR